MTQSPSKPPRRTAVCSWSLQPADPCDLIEKLAATGIQRVQLALDPLREAPKIWGGVGDLLRQNKIEIVSGMFGCVGEDYSTLETIRLTGGIAPDATWQENERNIRQFAAIAAELHLKLVTFHAGFLPHEKSDPSFGKMLTRLAAVANIFAEQNILPGLETGQETASSLAAFLDELNRMSVGVNFDPANMILYDKGDPIAAVRVLASRIFQVHIKDAVRTKIPGTWGNEVIAGTGEVDWRMFFAALREANFRGDLAIEREAGTERIADIIKTRGLMAEHWDRES